MTARVPNEPLRNAFLNSGLSASEVCRRLGWMHTRGDGWMRGDTSKLLRMLGIDPTHTGAGVQKRAYRTMVSAEDAEFLRRVMAADYQPRECECGETITAGTLCGWCAEGLAA